MIQYIERTTGKLETEKVYGEKPLAFVYGGSSLGTFFKKCISCIPLFSKLYGSWQKLPVTKKKIASFIQNYQVDAQEFQLPVEEFKSFNDFFIRKLKPSARPFDILQHSAIIPADGRYWFYQTVTPNTAIQAKGHTFSLAKLLGDEKLASRYQNGSMMIARLCPSDYHRFHFPCRGVARATQWFNGPLYSVNPISLKQDGEILAENKRALTLFDTDLFGTIAYIEIGATFVGSIHETFTSYALLEKGAEKGYFSFGGSALILLFEPGKILFSEDLIVATESGYEIRCLFGQRMGVSTTPQF